MHTNFNCELLEDHIRDYRSHLKAKDLEKGDFFRRRTGDVTYRYIAIHQTETKGMWGLKVGLWTQKEYFDAQDEVRIYGNACLTISDPHEFKEPENDET